MEKKQRHSIQAKPRQFDPRKTSVHFSRICSHHNMLQAFNELIITDGLTRFSDKELRTGTWSGQIGKMIWVFFFFYQTNILTTFVSSASSC
ncbi:Uncharacterized protein TCM_006854 [Theobroma cacao]|uniref:Uncharacterized protein n=1 Tax=Theobroma cacao TaxID=3641 RepID=A0A061DZ33_THECC|nr:Uncharacterized protein TCM_006854 [Theobroma cacao]